MMSEPCTVEYLRECFDLDPRTGVITWRVRPQHHFSGKHGWRTTNGRSAGRVAGTKMSKGYLGVGVCGHTIRVHRAVFALSNGKWPDGEIDHINGDPSDNRPDNLRVVTSAENMSNKGIYSRNATGEPNISYRADLHPNCRWHVQMVYRGTKHQAYFSTIEDARRWRDAMRAELGFHPNHGQRPSRNRSAKVNANV